VPPLNVQIIHGNAISKNTQETAENVADRNEKAARDNLRLSENSRTKYSTKRPPLEALTNAQPQA
jgi:hypothetical protein